VTKRRFLHISGAGRTEGTDSVGPDDARATTAATEDGRTGEGGTGHEGTGHGGTGAGISRRVFLVRSSLAAGAAAAVGSVPGLGNLLSVGGAESPEVGGMADDTAGAAGTAGAEAAPEMGEPLVAHVINTSTGEINLYQGTNQIVARNPGLAQAIARLAAPRG
jgi:hypothetical protein